jgi:hypothetical protein
MRSPQQKRARRTDSREASLAKLRPPSPSSVVPSPLTTHPGVRLALAIEDNNPAKPAATSGAFVVDLGRCQRSVPAPTTRSLASTEAPKKCHAKQFAEPGSSFCDLNVIPQGEWLY